MNMPAYCYKVVTCMVEFKQCVNNMAVINWNCQLARAETTLHMARCVSLLVFRSMWLQQKLISFSVTG